MAKKLTEDQQEKILRTGIRAFAEKGFEGANINTIAEDAGISVGVLYKYYESKENFFLSCVRRSLEALGDVLAPERLEGLPPQKMAEQLVRAALSFSRDHRDVILLYHQITNWEQGGKTRRLAREIEAESSAAYVKFIGTLQEQGMLHTDADPAYLAMFFDNLLMMLQFTGSCTYYDERWKIYCGAQDEEELVRQMTKVLGAFFRDPEDAAPGQKTD